MENINQNYKEKIAILITDLHIGGAERVVVNLANSFSNLGYEVEVVLLKAEGEFIDLLSSKVKLINLEANKQRYALWKIIKYINYSKPSILLACMWPITILAIIAKVFSKSNLKVFVAEHNSWSYAESIHKKILHPIIPLSMKLLFSLAKGIICVSNGASLDLSRYSKIDISKITTIYNPVIDLNFDYTIKLSSIDQKKLWGSAKYKIITIGSLDPQKNHKLLLDALYLLKKNMIDDFHMIILGEGPLKLKLETYAQELKLQSNITFAGVSKTPFPYIASADLFVLTSKWEGLSNVLIESLASGTPIVSTDCPWGPSEILDGGKYGKLTSIDDVAELTDSIVFMMNRPHDTNLLKKRANDFSIQNSVNKYLQLFFK